MWLKCSRCGRALEVKRTHTVPMAAYRCEHCESPMVPCKTRPPLAARKCYRELCTAEVDAGSRTCAEGHTQPPW